MVNDNHLPVVDVYIAKIPNDITFGTIVPKTREKEIMAYAHTQVKRQKYCAWKLLEYALNSSFGLPMSALKFEKDAHGKWSTSDCCFSITHCGAFVAVAVCRAKVGVDLESRSKKLLTASRKFLTEQEKLVLQTLEEAEQLDYLAGIWTQKESIFKAFGEGGFIPSKIQADEYCTQIRTLKDGLILTVATEQAACIRYYDNVEYL